MGQSLSRLFRHKEGRRKNPESEETSYAEPPAKDLLGDPIPEDSKVIDGRIFKKSGSPVYPLPNDKSEFGRLNSQHYVLRYTFQSNYKAPITEDLKRGIKVLDAGCGTGIWSIEVANEFPNSIFIGTDITNVFAVSAEDAPPNCTFLEADTTKRLPFGDNTFDYVFQRFQIACFTKVTWPIVIKELIRVCKPGGFVELIETTSPQDCGPALSKHIEWMETLFGLRGVDLTVFKTPELVINAGLIDVQSSHTPWRLNWGPDQKLGEVIAQNYVTGIHNFRAHIGTSLGLGDAEYDEVECRCEAELLVPGVKYKATQTIFDYYGRKPFPVADDALPEIHT